jgi:hypothetical protein
VRDGVPPRRRARDDRPRRRRRPTRNVTVTRAAVDAREQQPTWPSTAGGGSGPAGRHILGESIDPVTGQWCLASDPLVLTPPVRTAA